MSRAGEEEGAVSRLGGCWRGGGWGRVSVTPAELQVGRGGGSQMCHKAWDTASRG